MILILGGECNGQLFSDGIVLETNELVAIKRLDEAADNKFCCLQNRHFISETGVIVAVAKFQGVSKLIEV